MQLIRNCLILFVMLFLPLKASADTTAPIDTQNSSSSTVTAAVFSEQEVIRPGSPFWVAIKFQIPHDWHLYWTNPGSAGAPPKVSWNLPAGWLIGETQFPTPMRMETAGQYFYGYSDECVLLLPLTPPPSLTLGQTIQLPVDLSWVACGTSCVPGRISLTLSVKVGANSLENGALRALFTDARVKMPQVRSHVIVKVKGAVSEIQVPPQNGVYQNVSNVIFFPEKQGLFDPAFLPKWRLSENKRRLIVELPTKEKQDVIGILRFSYMKDGELRTLAIQVAKDVPEGQRMVQKMKRFYEIELSQVRGFFTPEFAAILLLAFAGGLILNIMPCVLPVVSLKVLHFIKMAGQGRATTFKHGALFSLGVISCFWLLALAIFVLQAFGKTVGWGFQLQEPLFVAILVIILYVLSLSLFGLFEFGTKIASIAAELDEVAKVGSPMKLDLPSCLSSFFSGVLATFVASPCTGPLLGSAIGFTATLSPLYAFFVFTALGVGMASPYLLLSLFPSLLKIIPRPGRWMVTFKQLMGFFLLATVLWLVWVLAAETKGLSELSLFSSLFCIAFGLWVYGTWGGFDRKSTTRAIAKFFALIIVLFGISTLLMDVYQGRRRSFDGVNEKSSQQKHREDLPLGSEWEPFSIARLDQLQQKGIPVFVEFSAKWCLICRANAVLLETKSVKEAFVKYGVVKMYADWTQMDDEMTQVMRSLGRNGVPVSVLYPKDRMKAPILFSELLSQDAVIEAMKQVHAAPSPE